jgi:hypothetical protein
MPPDHDSHDVSRAPDESRPPRPGGRRGASTGGVQARIGGFIARHRVVLKALDFLRKGPFDNVNP